MFILKDYFQSESNNNLFKFDTLSDSFLETLTK